MIDNPLIEQLTTEAQLNAVQQLVVSAV